MTEIGAQSSIGTVTPLVLAGESRGARILRILSANPLVLVGSALALLYVLGGLIGPFFAPFDYREQSLLNSFLPPFSGGHLLGTDQLGRDLLSRVLQGMQISLLIGIVITSVTLVVGGLLGIVAGYFGGLADRIISAAIDLAWGFPLILVAVLLVGAIGPGLEATMIAVAVVNWAGFARIIRGETLGLRNREFVEAARALGLPEWKVILRHIMPHLVPVTLVMCSYYVALAVIFEAGFSFVGIGAQPPLPSLGQMVGEGRNYMLTSHWIITVPGLVIALIVIGLNLLGDGLRDLYDPRLSDR